MEKSLLMEKSKAEESPWKKKIIKNRPKLDRERKGTTLSSKEKNSFVKTTCTSGASCWCLDFTKEVTVKPYMMLQTRFPFLYASTSLDTKTLKIASNCNFESCLSIHCLAS